MAGCEYCAFWFNDLAVPLGQSCRACDRWYCLNCVNDALILYHDKDCCVLCTNIFLLAWVGSEELLRYALKKLGTTFLELETECLLKTRGQERPTWCQVYRRTTCDSLLHNTVELADGRRSAGVCCHCIDAPHPCCPRRTKVKVKVKIKPNSK